MLNKFKLNTANQLFILLLVFLVMFGAQSLLNLQSKNLNERLDTQVKNAEVEGLIGRKIIKEIYEIQSYFFQLSTSPNKHYKKIILTAIHDDADEINELLNILNKGGEITNILELNLANTPKFSESYHFSPAKLDRFNFIKTDMALKLASINQKISQINQLLKEFEILKAQESPLVAHKLNQIKRQINFTAPLFTRLTENANWIFYTNKTSTKALKQSISEQRRAQSTFSNSFIFIMFFIALFIFRLLSKNINNTSQEMAMAQEYTHDILESQSNIIIVNDGKEILDVSGGFYDFFPQYDSLQAFANDFACICDLFVKETGYIYKFEDINWIQYLIHNNHKTHKVKIDYANQITVFQISAVKSNKYQRYIISMFDITENEKINNDLEIQKNTALAATQAKGEFLANMSHEIRTPLNAILGFIGLLRDKTHEPESERYLDTIDNSSHSLLGIINDILDFSKIESGKLDIDPIDFDPRKEFRSTADLFQARCSEKNITFSLNLSDSLPSGLKTDILRIKQVVANLLSNAVKFTEANKQIFLDIDYQNKHLICSVKDQGIGMSEEAQKHVFDAFSQAETSTTRKYGGTGLGLAISSKLIEMLGGKLQLESKLREGSRFFFSIPCEAVKFETKAQPHKSTSRQFSGHLLLVEDNKTNQLLMTAILNKQGVTFDIANDGLEAIDAVKQNQYDLVLMDENMPNLNGIEATKAIRLWEDEQNLTPLPIIALTANAMTGDREKFLNAGMNEYLTKPINLPKLIGILGEFLNKNLAE